MYSVVFEAGPAHSDKCWSDPGGGGGGGGGGGAQEGWDQP